MLIRRMTAVFGKLQGDTLDLQDGLNIIQAPNETGKSTWCAFLLAMLYGINSRERDKAGYLADKNRYAPWSGAAMSGRLDCRAGEKDITLLRTTKRATAPMSEFQALYTNTADSVPDLTSALCGEQLLGVTRDVYSRSAFIRQNSLSIEQSAELERRIATLISSGEESTSYSEAANLLKKQINRRQHNRTGQIPALEAELQQLQRQFAEANSLSEQILQLREQEEVLGHQEQSLQQELLLHERWIRQLQSQQRKDAEKAVTDLQRTTESLHHQLEADRIPENDAIARLRGAIVNLHTAHRSLQKLRDERDEAMKALLHAEAAVTESPFAGQTAVQAQKFADSITAPTDPSGKTLIWQIILGVLAIALGIIDLPNFYFGIPLGLLAVINPFYQRYKRRRALDAVLKKHHVSSPEALQALASDYAASLAIRDAAQAELDKRSAAADTLYNSISANEQAILLEIRRFAPAACDLSAADSLLRGCAIRRKEVADAENALREAILRRDILSQTTEAIGEEVPQPHRSQAEAAADLTQTFNALSRCRNTIQHLSGQLSAYGDTAQLQADIQDTNRKLEELQNEHASLQLALGALDAANQTMQNRFAPALGKHTAQLFHQLSDGRYEDVVLDRSLHLSAEPAGDHIYRDISLLSAGAADQLYLAARLAICEMVLPAEQNAPIILDDALANFDDHRCAAALCLLKEMARHRQIILFTCHEREAAFFSNDKEVTILQLTNRAEKV